MHDAGEQRHRVACWETSGWFEWRYHKHGNWHDLHRMPPWNTRRTRGACASPVEWDQGQMTGAALVMKLRAYTHSTRSREGARELRPMLGLRVVTPDLTRNNGYNGLRSRVPRPD